MVAAREDLLSTLTPIPTFEDAEQRTENNIIRYNDDGTISITPIDEDSPSSVSHDPETPDEWNENLADALSATERMNIADDLIELYEVDCEVRKVHFERLRDGLELLGLTDIPGSNVPFEGAAQVNHPMIAEALVQFNARAIEEYFPPTGPVKAHIVGEATDEKRAQGERLADYLNYQLTEQDEDYYENTDQMLFYLPMSGSAFKKVYIDPITGMTTSRFVTAEDFIVPYHAKSLRSASRYCHRYEMHANDVYRAQAKGAFLEDARLLPTPSVAPDRGVGINMASADSMEDLADDREHIEHEDDTIYTFLEYHIDLAMPWDDEDEIAPPYIVTVEKESREVMSVRRNWKYGDELMQKRIWFVHYKYLPGLGFYGFGLLHMIGSLAKAASGGIRALLDSAVVANLQGGFKSKEAKIAGEVRFTPGEWKDVDMAADELEKSFFNLPVKEPSTALAQLVQTLVEEGRRFMTTTENMVGEASNQGPVGTTLALIEQGSKVFSGVHKRMHKSSRQEFKLMATLNYEFMEVEEYPYEIQGEERQILKSDFDGRVDVIPVSDPNIWSQTQRIAQSQGTLELIGADPEIYPKKARILAHRRMLEAMRVPDVDEILPEPQDEMPVDPVTENMTMMTGGGARAFPDQYHEAHIMVHMNFAQTMAAENAEAFKLIEPMIQSHILEHRAYMYRQQVEADLGIPLPPHDLADPNEQEEMPQEVETMISIAVARKLRPPPPPAPTPEEQEEQARLQEDEDKKDALVIGELQRKQVAHQQQMTQDQEAFEAAERRKDDEAKADSKRKDAEHKQTLALDKKETEADIDNEETKAKATSRIRSSFGAGPRTRVPSNTGSTKR